MSRQHLRDATAVPADRARLEARFWPKVLVQAPNDCWPWIAKARHPFGYGRMTAGRNRHLKAHQIAYALKYGEIPEAGEVCHRCDNPGCCNPEHLFIGTHQQNVADAVSKGRNSPPPIRFGEQHHKTTFDALTALRISVDRRSARVIADEHNISQMTVYRLRKGRTWRKLLELGNEGFGFRAGSDPPA